jgi:glycosyltransferase involved in cell wall biosynthesis
MASKVSIGIPTYNGSHKLRQAIVSILGQTYHDFEIIVSDDCSTDDTSAVIATFSDKRIKYFRNGENAGVPANWNRSVELSAGEYFALLPHDDLYCPEFLAEMVPALERQATVGFALCGVYNVDEQLRPLSKLLIRDYPFTSVGAPALDILLRDLPCPPVAILFRRSAMVKMGLWSEHFWDDWAFIVRTAFRHGFTFVPKLLACNRVHSEQLSGTLAKSGRDDVLDLINQTFAVFGDALPATPRLLALRARSNRALSHACMLKMFKALLRGGWHDAAFQFSRARHLYPIAGLDLGFLSLWLRHRRDAHRTHLWKRGNRMGDKPVVLLENLPS